MNQKLVKTQKVAPDSSEEQSKFMAQHGGCDGEATMRSGNYPKFNHEIADELARLARMSVYWWMPAPEWFWSQDPGTTGDGVERAKISDVLYVTTPEGGLVDLLMYVYVDPSGERFNPDPLACLDTHHCRVSVRFSNYRLASYQVKRRTVESIVEYFAARISGAAPKMRG